MPVCPVHGVDHDEMPEHTTLLGSMFRHPLGMARAAVNTLRTEVAFQLLALADRVAPLSATGIALDPRGGSQIARICTITHSPLAGGLLTVEAGKKFSEALADMRDLAGLYAEPSAPDPFDTPRGDG